MIAKACSRVNLMGLIAAILVCLGQPVWAGGYRIGPVSSPSQMRLLPASSWPFDEPSPTATVLKLSYLRGLMDAMQYVQLAPATPQKVLSALKGLSLKELADLVERYYESHPQARKLPPAAVVLRLLPQEMSRSNQGVVPSRMMGYKNSPQHQPERE